MRNDIFKPLKQSVRHFRSWLAAGVLGAAALISLPQEGAATTFTSTVPGTNLVLPADYPQAGGVAIVMVGVNGNAYYQFSDPTGAFQGYQNTGTPAQFRGNPFTINSPISLNCGFSSCSDYFGGGIAQVYIRFTAYDGDTQAGQFDFNDISLILNGFNVGNWSTIRTESTSNDGLTSFGFGTGFGNNTLDTGWFTSTDPGLLANILSTGRTTTQVFDRDPNDNYWDFRIGSTLTNRDIVTVAPGYSLDKTTQPVVTTYSTVGQQVTFRYVVTNIGSVPIRNLSVVDDKIATVSCDKTTILAVPFGSPTPDAAICTGVYTVTQVDIDNGSVTNIARAAGTPDFGTLGQLSDSVTLTGPVRNPLLSLDKATTATAFGAVGSTVPYTFRATNTGNVTLTNVVVTDPRLPGLSCTIPSLAPNAQLSCSASYTVRQADVDAFAAGTNLVNTATVRGTSPTGSTVTASDTVSLTGPAAAPAMTVDKATTTANFNAVGQVVPYTITLRNTGNVTWPAAPAVTDPLAPVTCPAGTIAPGAAVICNASYTVTQADIDRGSIINTASASITVGGVVATGQDTNTLNATITTGLTLDKRLAPASPSSFSATGVLLSYEYVLRNTGNVTLNTVSVTDDRTTVSCPATTLAPGATLICTATSTTTQANLDAGGITNTATATGTPASGGAAITSAPDSVTVTAVRNPALTLDKTGPSLNAGQYRVGRVVTYRYEVTNSGNVTLAGPVTVADDRAGTFQCAAGPIAPGATVNCTRTYTLTADDILAGVVINVATASANGTTSNQDSFTISPSRNPAITLEKTAGLASVDATSDVIPYDLRVTNSGNTQILLPDQPITVTDPRAGAVDCSAQPAVLDPGDSFSCTATVTPTQAELDAGEVENTARASFPYTAGGVTLAITSPDSIEVVPATQSPALELVKSGPPDFSAVGEVLTYTFAVTNIGNVTLTTATVTDPLIPGLSCTLGPIAPTATAQCTGTYAVTQADIDAEQIVNTASALGATQGGGAPTDTATVTTPIDPAAPLKSASIEKLASRTDFSAAGELITYTIAVTNDGNQTLAGFTVTDALDPAYSCTIASIAPGATSTQCQFPYTVTQSDIDAGSIINSASVTQADVGTLTDSVTVPGPARVAAFTATKAALDSFAAVGDSIRFGLTVTNTGNVTLTNVVVNDPLLVTPGPVCTIATLAPGASDSSCLDGRSYSVTQTDIDNGSVQNTATVSATPPVGVTSPAPLSPTATATGPVRVPGVEIDKIAAGPFGGVGSTAIWTFTVTNTGNVTLNGVSVEDPSTGFSCLVGSLLPGDVATTCQGGAPLSTSRVITQADVDAGNLSNTATVAATAAVTGTPVADSDTVSIPGPAQVPALTVAKVITGGGTFDTVGDVVSYSYTVTNTGNITLTAPISVADDRIARVNCPVFPAAGIAPLGTYVCTATYRITQADLDAGNVVNVATASAAQPVVPRNPGDPTTIALSNTDTATATASQLPALQVEKRLKAGTPVSFDSVGDVLTYEYVVTNIGNVTTTAPVTIADDRIPGSLICAAPGLTPGASAVCEQVWTATQPAIDAGGITNTATAATSFGGSPVTSAPDSVTVPSVRTPSLSLDKQLRSAVPNLFDVDTVLSYDYVISNTGNVTVDGPFTIADNLAAVSCPAVASLVPTATVTCTANYTITPNDIILGSTTNTATASGSFAGLPVASNPDTVTYPVTADPALSLVKTATTPNFDAVGDVIGYSYLVTNSGGAGFAGDITVTDDKAGAFICRPASLGIFSVGVTHTCTIDYTVTQADVDRGFVTNNAVARTVFAPGTANEIAVASPGDDATVPAVETPALSVDKTVAAGPSPAAVGDVLSYQITVTNSGNQTISGITVSDPRIPALACTLRGAPVPENLVLLPTEAAICSGTYTVTQADLDTQVLANTATATGADPQGATVTQTDSTTHPLASPTPALTTVKVIEPDPGADPAFVAVGQVVNFRVSVTNSGNVTVNNVAVTDDLVAGTCTIGTLIPGQTDDNCTFAYTVTQADIDRVNGTAPVTGGFTNTAIATGQPANPGAAPVTDEGSVFAEGPEHEPAFSLVKEALTPGFSAAGDVLAYRFTVANTGNITLSDVPQVTDDKIGTIACGPLPATGLSPGAFVTCTANYTVTQADMDAGQVTNIASVASPEVPLPTPPGPATDSATVPGTRTPAMTVEKSASITADAVVGDTITYTYIVTNTGNVTLTGVTPSDSHTSAAGTVALALGGDALETDGGLPGGSTDAAANGVWDSLAPGDAVRFTATYTVTQADIDAGNALANTVSVTAGSPSGTTPPTATDDLTVSVEGPVPGLSVVKIADLVGLSAPPVVGDVVGYVITVENTGNVTLSSVTPVDTLSDASGTVQALDAAPLLVSGDDGNAQLDVGETWTYTAGVTLTQAMIDTGGLSNTVTVEATAPNGTPVSDVSDDDGIGGSDPTVTPLTRTPGIEVIKTADSSALSAPPRAGEVVTFAITVENTGNVRLSSVALNDRLTRADGTVLTLTSGPVLTGGDGATVGVLDPAEVWTYSASYALQQADIDAGGIVNQADALASAPNGTDVRDRSDDGVPGGTDDPTRVPLTAVPGIEGEKTLSAAPVTVGSTVGFTITVTNTGNTTLTASGIASDTLTRADGTVLALTSGPSFFGASLGSAEGTLLPGEVASYDVRYTLTQADLDAGGISNTAVVTGTPPGGAALTDVTDNGNDADGNTEDDAVVLTLPAAPALTLDKRLSAGSGPAFDAVGDVLAFDFVLVNAGNVTLPGPFAVSDPLITGAGGSITCPAGPLAPTATLTCTGIYSVTQADLDAGEIINSATASSPLGETLVSSLPDSVTIPAVQSPALSLVKTAESVAAAQFVVGAVVDYTYVVTNTGNITLTGPVTVADNRIPAVSCPAVPSGGLAPAATLTCTGSYTVTADDVDLGVVTNLATASSGPTDSPRVSETVPDSGVPLLSMTKTATTDNFAAVGDVIDYSFVVTNAGTRAFVQPVVVQDSLIGPVTCYTPSGSDPDFRPDESVTCSAPYTVTQADIDAGRVVNEANAETTYGGGTPVVSDAVTETVLVSANPALTLVKSATPAFVSSVGETVRFGLTITNSGNQTLRAIEVTDPMLPGLICRAATLAPAASTLCEAPYVVTQADIDRGSLINTAAVTGVTPAGGLVSATGSTSVGIPEANPAMTLEKTATPTPFGPVGSAVSYRLAVTNTGTVTLTGLSVTDPMAPALSCAVARLAPGETSAPCSFAVTVTQADIDRGSLTNTAAVSGRAPDGTLVGDTATLVTPGPAPRPTLEVTKTVAPMAPVVGQPLVFTLTVRNSGTVTLTPQPPVDTMQRLDGTPVTLDAPFALISGDDGDGRLQVAEVWTYRATRTLTQADIDAGGLSNSASVTAAPPSGPPVTDVSDDGIDSDGNSSDDPTVYEVPSAPQLTVTKVVTTPGAAVGDQVVFTITAANTGNSTLSGLAITDNLTRRDGTVLPASPVLATGSDPLAPGGSLSWTVTHRLTQADIDAGGLSNSAVVRGTGPGGVPVSDRSADDDPADGNTEDDPTDLILAPVTGIDTTKTLVSIGTAVDEAAIFEVTVVNTGTVTLTGVTLADRLSRADGTLLPAPVPAFVSASLGSAEGTLLPGETGTWRITHVLTQADIDAGGLINQVTTTATPPAGPALIDLSDDDPAPGGDTPTTAPITGDAGLSVVKIADLVGLSAPPVVGDVVGYVITVENTGNVTLSSVTPVDTLSDASGTVQALDAAPLLVSGDDGNAQLDVGETWTYTAGVTLTQAMIDTGGLSNTVTVEATAPNGTPVSDVSDDDGIGGSDPTVTPLTRTPGIEVIKTADSSALSAPPRAGEVVTFAITVENTGNVRLSSVALNDRLTRADGTVLTLTSGPVLTGGDGATVGVLDPAEVWTYSASYALQQADIDAGGIVNQADALASAPNGTDVRDRSDDGVPGGTDDPTRVPLTAVPGIEGEKTLSAAPVTVGSTVGFTITVTNTGNTTLTASGIASDTLTRADGTVLALTSGPSFFGASLGSAEGTLLPGEVASYDVRYTLTQADLDAGGISNTAVVTGTPPGGAALTDVTDNGNDADGNTEDDAVVLTLPAAPALTLDKRLSAGSGPAFDAVGDVLAFDFVLVNAGNVTLPGPFAVSDPLITGAGGSITCPAGPLAPTATLTCTGIYSVTQADLDAGEIINSATASSPLGETLVSSLPDSVTIPAVQSPALSLVKTAESVAAAQFVVGAVVDYTYVVTNTGNITLTGPVTVADNRIPAVSCPAVPSGGLAPAATLTCTGSYTVTADDVDLGVVTNLATASSGPTDSPRVSETVPDSGVPLLSMTKTATTDNFAAVGDVIDYSFVVTNAGTRAFVQPVVVQDSLIGPVTCYTPSGSDPDFRPDESVTCSAPYTVTQADIDAGRVVNEANAETTYGGGTPVVSDAVTETVLVSANPALTLVKSATPAFVSSVGETVRFGLTITNSGNQTLRAIEVTDPMLPGLICRAATLAPAASTLCEAPYVVTQADIDRGSLINTAAVTGVTPAGGLVSATGSTSVGIPEANPAMTLEKTATPTPFGPVGSAVSYRLAVTNTGTVTLTGLSVTDPMAPALSCAVARLAPGETSAPCSFAVTVTQADIDRGSLTNTAAVSGRAPDGTLVGDTATLVTPGPAPRPTLEVTKTVAPMAPVVGQPLVFTLTVRNSGTVTLTPQPPVDTMQRLDGTPVTLDAPFALISGDDGDGRLQVAEVWTYRATRTLTQADIDAGGLSNSASVTAAPPSGPPVTDVSDDGIDSDGNSSDDPTVYEVPSAPQLTVTKVVTTPGAAVGDQVVFTITAANTGNSTLSGLAITDNLTRRDGTVLPASPVLATGSDPLAPGGSLSWTVTHRLTQADIDAGGLSNSAVVRGTGPGGVPVSDRSADDDPADGNTEDDPTDLILAPVTGIDTTKTLVSIGTAVDEAAIFEVTVVNTGTVTLTGVTLADRLSRADGTLLPAPVPAFVSASLGSAEGTLLPGETGTWRITHVLTQADIDAGGLINQVTTTATPPAGPALIDLSDDDPAPGGDTPTTAPITGDAGLSVVKIADLVGLSAPPVVGDVVGYVITVENTGNVTLSSVTPVDTLSDASGTVQALDAAPLLVSGDDGNALLDVGETWTYTAGVTLTQAMIDTGGLSNTVTVEATAPNGTPVSDVSDDGNDTDGNTVDDPTVTTLGVGRLMSASKSADRTSVVVGETVTFTLTFENATTIAYTDATFVDVLPPGLSYTPGSARVNGTASEPVAEGNRLTWGPRDLVAGGRLVITLQARVGPDVDPGTLTNRTFMLDNLAQVVTNVATASLRVVPEAVFDCSDVIGKVFLDRNGNGVQDPDPARAALSNPEIFLDKWGKLAAPTEPEPTDEPGIAGVRLATVNGLLITTDEFGRYHVPCAALPLREGSNFTLKLDARTLPQGLMVASENPRTLRLTAGKVAKMNFALQEGNRVDIDLTDSAFEPGTAKPSEELTKGIRQLVRNIRKTPSVIYLTYVIARGEAESDAMKRLRAVENALRQAWITAGTYQLVIQKSVQKGRE
ncbi:beta strand repeat-containing protein [Thioclava sp. FR2]|uniref:beta strand repeat-containing protein n=1 Tax=Thioclava sp. FR2 TaxID=3445780 RepID=UPI003EB77FC9